MEGGPCVPFSFDVYSTQPEFRLVRLIRQMRTQLTS
jgi:hypothetical protein